MGSNRLPAATRLPALAAVGQGLVLGLKAVGPRPSGRRRPTLASTVKCAGEVSTPSASEVSPSMAFFLAFIMLGSVAYLGVAQRGVREVDGDAAGQRCQVGSKTGPCIVRKPGPPHHHHIGFHAACLSRRC